MARPDIRTNVDYRKYDRLVLLGLSILVAFYPGAAGGQDAAATQCSLGDPKGQVKIDLAGSPSGDWTVSEFGPGDDARVVVYGVNPFMGAHRVEVGEDQALESSDPVELVAKVVRWVLPGASAAAPLASLGQKMLPPNDTLRPGCPVAQGLLDRAAQVENLRTGIEAKLSGLDTLYSAWRTLKTKRGTDTLFKSVSWIQETGDSVRSALRHDSADIRGLATTLEREATRLADAADNLSSEPCASAAVDAARRVAQRARIQSAESLAVVTQPTYGRHLAQVDTVMEALRLFPNECSQYRIVEAIPLKDKPTAVDVKIQMAPAGSTDESAFRTLEHRRLRFDDPVPLDVGIGVGAFWSSIPKVEFGTRDVPIAPPPGAAGDTTVSVIAVDEQSDDRFVPAVVLSFSHRNARWLRGVVGVGVNADGKPSANYLLGGGIGSGPVTFVVAATAAEVSYLKGDLLPGDPLSSADALDVGNRLRWGWALGLNLKLR